MLLLFVLLLLLVVVLLLEEGLVIRRPWRSLLAVSVPAPTVMLVVAVLVAVVVDAPPIREFIREKPPVPVLWERLCPGLMLVPLVLPLSEVDIVLLIIVL